MHSKCIKHRVATALRKTSTVRGNVAAVTRGSNENRIEPNGAYRERGEGAIEADGISDQSRASRFYLQSREGRFGQSARFRTEILGPFDQIRSR